MKIKVFLTSIILMFFVLAACTATLPTPAASADNAAQASNGGGGQGTNGGGQGPNGGGQRNTLESRLAIGLLKLEGTAQAVTADQAKQLIPLWQQVKTQGANGAANQADIQTTYQQIEKVLTSDQTTAIQNMSLSQTDIQDMMKTLGIQITPGAGGFGRPNNNGTPFPTMSADQRATRTAQRTLTPGSGNAGAGGFGGGRGGFGFNQMFIDPLITLLQKRAGG
jgi:hypothetical protein